MPQARESPPPLSHEEANDPAVSKENASDSGSDHDTNEKSARDQLEKTTIASLNKNAVSVPSPDGVREADIEESTSVEIVQNSSHEGRRAESPRGRSIRKRSFDRSDSPANEHENSNDQTLQPFNGHARKRSRDVRSTDKSKVEERRTKGFDDVYEEEGESGAEEEQEIHRSPDPSDGGNDDSISLSPASAKPDESVGAKPHKETSSEVGSETLKTQGQDEREEGFPIEDQEMKEGVYSPRKKRSRDQLDSAADREQKIAATDIARAQRRSDEINRAEVMSTKPSINSSFGTPSVFRPPDEQKQQGSADKVIGQSKDEAAPSQKPASPQAFASSGFATLAASSTSPFGLLNSQAQSTAPSPFAGPPKNFAADPKEEQNTGPKQTSSFGSFTKPASSVLSTASPFALTGASQGNAFGGSAFGSGFGSGFGTGTKLTSFAAPAGDANLSGSNGALKPIGSSSNDDAENDESESAEDTAEDKSREEEGDETDERFQQQDVETGEDGEESIFSSRASLFTFKENAWKEGGKGTFKLNIPTKSNDSESSAKNGRFIMRAHQTFRVLLNAPIFPQMKVGDSRGMEPSGKSFAFAVIEDGKPTPYMVKLGDLNESKALYHEVRKLQQR